MGICASCFGGQSAEYDTMESTDADQRRQQMAEAADKRRMESESRGLKDPEKVKQQQRRKEELERRHEAAGNQEGGLKWQVG